MLKGGWHKGLIFDYCQKLREWQNVFRADAVSDLTTALVFDPHPLYATHRTQTKQDSKAFIHMPPPHFDMPPSPIDMPPSPTDATPSTATTWQRMTRQHLVACFWGRKTDLHWSMVVTCELTLASLYFPRKIPAIVNNCVVVYTGDSCSVKIPKLKLVMCILMSQKLNCQNGIQIEMATGFVGMPFALK